MISINVSSANQFVLYVNLIIACLAYGLICFDLDISWQLSPIIISCLLFLLALMCIILHFYVISLKVNQQTLTLPSENIAACTYVYDKINFSLDVKRSRLSYFGCWLVFTSQSDTYSKFYWGNKNKSIFVPKYQLPIDDYRTLCRVLIWQ